MDLKMHPTIQHTDMKLDAKYQQATIYSSWEKRYENFNVWRNDGRTEWRTDGHG